MKKHLVLTLSLLLLVSLYVISRYNYLLFHSIAELFSIIIACGIFMVAWNSRHYFENQYLLFVGIAYLFIGILDVVHTFTYKGMFVLPGFDANVPTQLWIAARYLESLTLLAAPLMIQRRIKAGRMVLIYGAVSLLLLLSILQWRIFPDCYLESAGGLTPFKKTSEYLISAILLASGLLLLKYRRHFDGKVLLWLVLSILMKILSELAFSTYADVYDYLNLIGHYFKILSFFLIYKAIVETGLTKPYDLLFKRLKQTTDSYHALFMHMINGLARHRVLYDTAGKPVDYEFLEVNEAFERLTGLTDVVGRKVTEVIPGLREEPVDWIGTYGTIATEGGSLRFEKYSESLGKWYSVIAYSPGKGEFATIFEDISNRKQSEDVLRKSEARFKLLSDMAGRLLAAEDPQDIINELCRDVLAHLDCQVFFNFMVDEASERLRLNAYAGIPDQEARRIEWLDYGVAVCGCVARDGCRIIAEEIRDTPDLRTELVKSYGIQAYCCHPMMVQGRLIGTLSFGTKTRPRFTADEVDLMQTVTHQVALANQRLQTQHTLQCANEALEGKVQERTATLAHLVDTLQVEVDYRQQAEYRLQLVNEQLNARAYQLRKLTSELAIAEQRERMRLSRILHDGLQQQLAAARIQLACVAEQTDAPKQKETLEAIVAMIAQSIQMTRSLSTSLSPSVLHEGGLAAGLKWLANWMKNNYNLRVALSIEAAPKVPMETKIILFECVRELLFNVVKHSGVPTATLSLRPSDAETMTLTVRDEGVGFDPGLVKSIETIGGGLGLFSIRERIGFLGGRFQVESGPGQGSCFTLTIPCKGSSSPASDFQSSPPSTRLIERRRTPRETRQPIRVLIADDHALFRDGIARLLDRDPGITIVGQATNGREAIALAHKLVPDVILMDISMPELNGIEATRAIHKELPAIRIIGLSMHDDEDGSQAMYESGAIGYQNKGCTTAELASAIRAAVQVMAA